MKAIAIRNIGWDRSEKERIVWPFPERINAWNSKLLVAKDQAVALVTGRHVLPRKLKLHDIFLSEGSHAILPETVPLFVSENPESISRPFIESRFVFCSLKERAYAPKVYAGDSRGQAWVNAEAKAFCKFRIADPEKFFKNVVASHNKTSNDAVLNYLDKLLGDELFRQKPPYNWEPKQKLPIEDVMRNIGIELLELSFRDYKDSAGAFAA